MPKTILHLAALATSATLAVLTAACHEAPPVTESFGTLQATSSLVDPDGRAPCSDGSCIETRLADTATGRDVATFHWDAERAAGRLIEDGRISDITLERALGQPVEEGGELQFIEQDSIVQLAEDSKVRGPLDLHKANRASVDIWQGMHTPPDSTSSSSVCTTTESQSNGCKCYTYVCMVCGPSASGEICTVVVTGYCIPTSPTYGPGCHW